MNPGKFFGIKSKLLNIPALVFRPGIFGFSMKIMIFLSPIIGKIAIVLMGKHKKVDSLDFELTTHACAKCGNCIAVCPAYLVTKNEEMTAKGKIALAKKLIEGKDSDKRRSGKCIYVHALQGL